MPYFIKLRKLFQDVSLGFVNTEENKSSIIVCYDNVIKSLIVNCISSSEIITHEKRMELIDYDKKLLIKMFLCFLDCL